MEFSSLVSCLEERCGLSEIEAEIIATYGAELGSTDIGDGVIRYRILLKNIEQCFD